MDSLMNAVAPRSPAPAKKPSEVDFRSGAALDQLSSQVSELVLLEQGDFGDQTALEVHTAKDFIFNMLGTPSDVCCLPRGLAGPARLRPCSLALRCLLKRVVVVDVLVAAAL